MISVEAKSFVIKAQKELIYIISPFLKSASKEMAVDGSSADQEFEVNSAAGELWTVHEIRLIMLDNNGNNNHDTFGSLTSLTNGVQLEQKINGVFTEIINFKDNADLVQTINYGGGFLNKGFLSDDSLFLGNVNFDNMTLNGDNGDLLRFTIRDDLSTFAILQASVKMRRS